MINKLRRRLAHARRLRQLRRLIDDAPTATVRWDLLTIAIRTPASAVDFKVPGSGSSAESRTSHR
jgi:hypothetical protein